jgi:hypothetical protein
MEEDEETIDLSAILATPKKGKAHLGKQMILVTSTSNPALKKFKTAEPRSTEERFRNHIGYEDIPRLTDRNTVPETISAII